LGFAFSFDPTRTIPKTLKQHPTKKKITQSAIFKDLGEKLPDLSDNWESNDEQPSLVQGSEVSGLLPKKIFLSAH
jgi:hypothetical protein